MTDPDQVADTPEAVDTEALAADAEAQELDGDNGDDAPQGDDAGAE